MRPACFEYCVLEPVQTNCSKTASSMSRNEDGLRLSIASPAMVRRAINMEAQAHREAHGTQGSKREYA